MRKLTPIQIRKFKTYLFEEEKSKATIEKYDRDLRLFLGRCFEKNLRHRIFLQKH